MSEEIQVKDVVQVIDNSVFRGELFIVREIEGDFIGVYRICSFTKRNWLGFQRHDLKRIGRAELVIPKYHKEDNP